MDETRELEITAHHEAAHAVAFSWLGFRVKSIAFHPEAVVHPVEPARTRGMAVSLMAGPAADEYLLRDDPDALRAVAHLQNADRGGARALSDELGGDQPERHLASVAAEAAELVRRHWAIIRELARELIERHRLHHVPLMDEQAFSTWISGRLPLAT